VGNLLDNTGTEGAEMGGALPCGHIGRLEDYWEILKWFQGMRERLALWRRNFLLNYSTLCI
jgi:hypothetical protein